MIDKAAELCLLADSDQKVSHDIQGFNQLATDEADPLKLDTAGVRLLAYRPRASNDEQFGGRKRASMALTRGHHARI
jgi:hypothetical protein